MAVNITVNGKFSKYCGRGPILNDTERVRKELEEDRRIKRLQQVRAESKNIARKIRIDVAEEKQRQLRKLEEIKAKELNCWRQHVRTQQNQALCQVGMAHQAAKLENEAQAAKMCYGTHTTSYKTFRKKITARRMCGNAENQQNNANLTSVPKVTKSTNAQTKICRQIPQKSAIKKTCSQYRLKTKKPAKRKRKKSVRKCQPPCCSCSEHEEQSERDTSCSESSVTSSCSDDSDIESVSTENEESVETSSKSTQTKKKCVTLLKTPAIFFDVEEDSCESIVLPPSEINDKHTESNRQFSRVVRSNTPKSSTERYVKSPSETSQTTASLIEKSKPKKKISVATKSHKTEAKKKSVVSSQKKTPQKKSAQTNTDTNGPQLFESRENVSAVLREQQTKRVKPRFTQVSDMVQKRKNSPRKDSTSPTNSTARPITPPLNSCQQTIPTVRQKSPQKTFPMDAQKSPHKSVSQSPRKDSAFSKSSAVAPGKLTATGSSKSSAATVTIAGSKSTSDSVQFYDYNNKFEKNYPQPQNAVKLRPPDCIQPNAMNLAHVEKQLREAKEKEIDQLRKKQEERGQKALEREQVRRDCNDLTEKLESLMRQHPQLIPNDASLNPTHRYVDRAARNEIKMNSAIEEILMRPAIITCPEVRPQRRTVTTDKSAKVTQHYANAINLGEEHKKGITNNTSSSESCCSILLGYVNDQRQQLRNDLSEYETRPTQNQSKTDKLKSLLQRIDSLRDALQRELQNGDAAAGSQNVEQTIDSIGDLRRERQRILIDEVQQGQSPLSTREKELQQKEAILEQKVREFYKKQKNANLNASSSEDSEQQPHIVHTKSSNPVEIIIKLKGPGESGIVGDKTSRTQKLSQRNDLKKIDKKKPLTAVNEKPITPTEGQNSYDSYSTAYRSLPHAITTDAEALGRYATTTQIRQDSVKRPTVQNEFCADRKNKIPLNPLVAQYVQRLLGMSRNSVMALDASSSDIVTPSESIINTTANKPHNVEALMSQERLERVHQFVEQNRSFIQEIEATLLNSQSRSSLEESLRSCEEVWTNRLRAQGYKKSSESVKAAVSCEDEESVGFEVDKRRQNREAQMAHTSSGKRVNDKIGTDISLKEKNKSVKSIKKPEREAIHREPAAQLREGRNEKAVAGKADFKSSSTHLQKEKTKSGGPMPHGSKERAFAAPFREGGNVLQKAKSRSVDSIRKTDEFESNMRERRTESGYIQQGSTSNLQKEKSKSGDSKKRAENLETKVKHTSKDDLQKETDRSGGSIRRTVGFQPNVKEHRAMKQTSSEESAQPADAENRENRHKDVGTTTSSLERNTEAHIQRYDKLASNCTHRIAELNLLINKVREEKLRLLEVTLSSTSDQERNSTEYFELPDDKNRPQTTDDQSSVRTESKALDSKSSHNDDLPTSSIYALRSENVTLVKGKQTGISRDSGISGISRPVTAQGQHTDIDPASFASTSQASSQRKSKPPPTLNRFSPQLIEDEVPHELSTIIEVDTPATSRVNFDYEYSIMQQHPVPLTFPTFEQYAQDHNLDLTLVQPEQSERLQRAFYELVAAIQETPQRAILYREFPSLDAYLRNITGYDDEEQQELNSPENIEELLKCLRAANIALRSFPTRQQYMQRQAADDPDCGFIDTASLENISTCPPDTESEPLENRRRAHAVLCQAAGERKICTSDVCTGSQSAQIHAAVESGIEKLSTSTSDLDRELQALGLQWPVTMRRKIKQTEAFCSDTSTSLTFNSRSTSPVAQHEHRGTHFANGSSRQTSQQQQQQQADCSDNGMARTLNLREFLTRELLKHSRSSSYSDDSLSSNFFQSVLGRITPNGTLGNECAAGVSNNNARTGSNLDRQKTSTPRMRSAETTTTSTTQLFSGESRISSVHFQDRTTMRSCAKENEPDEIPDRI